MAKNNDFVHGQKVTTPSGRLWYPHIFMPNTKGKYPSGKYETGIFIPKKYDINPLLNVVKILAKEAFGGRVSKMSDLLFPPIKDGDLADDPILKGHWLLQAKTNEKPIVVGEEIVNEKLVRYENPEEAYSGRNAKVSAYPMSYEQGGRPGITWRLCHVQLLKGGDRVRSSSGNPESDFEPVASPTPPSTLDEETF